MRVSIRDTHMGEPQMDLFTNFLRQIPPGQARVALITPQIAADLLHSNRDTVNRKPNLPRVRGYAQIMARNGWMLNGDNLKFDTNNKLLDGQHRLMACVQSGRPFRTYVVVNLAPEVFSTIDAGMGRSPGQVLAIAQCKNGHVVAAAVRRIGMIGRGTAVKEAVSSDEVLQFWLNHPRISESAKVGASTERLLPTSVGTALHFMFTERDARAADQFFADLATGAGLFQFDPLYLLRERLIRERQGNKKRRAVDAELASLCIRAWNARRNGISQLSKLYGMTRHGAGEDATYTIPAIE